MAYYLKLYFSTLAVFFAIDMFWLELVARTFYRKHLGFLMAPNPNWLAAIIFYLLFIVGILVFVVLPGFDKSGSLRYVWLIPMPRRSTNCHAQRPLSQCQGHDLVWDSAKCNGLSYILDGSRFSAEMNVYWRKTTCKPVLLHGSSHPADIADQKLFHLTKRGVECFVACLLGLSDDDHTGRRQTILHIIQDAAKNRRLKCRRKTVKV